MARPRRLIAPLAAALTLAFAAAAPAQGLRKLHVEALSMRADRTQVRVHEVFHLAIHVRVRERVAAVDELVVPDVGTLLLEGDERHVSGSPAGTDVVETLTLEPVAAGTYTFRGAYLDAIDARTGKPSRFSANPVRVVVTGPSVADSFWPVLRAVLGVAIALLALVSAAIVLFAFVKTRRRRDRPAVKVAEPLAAAPAPAPPRTPRDEVAAALRAYRNAPANGSLTTLRGALFAAAGTSSGATLRDALAATPDRSLRAALIAAERTAFGPAHARDAASAELIDAAEAWLR
jgi:hypothetical protein